KPKAAEQAPRQQAFVPPAQIAPNVPKQASAPQNPETSVAVRPQRPRPGIGPQPTAANPQAPARPWNPIPAPAPLPIQAPKLESERVVRELPAPIGNLIVGGGGRF